MTVAAFGCFRAGCYSTAVSGAHKQRLKYWFKLADPQTRNTFLSGRKNNHLPEIFVPVRRLFRLYLAAISAYSNL